MIPRRAASFSLLVVGLLALASVLGCPFAFEKESRPNSPPTTFFLGEPPDTTFRNEIGFTWSASDLDTDVVAFQFQLVKTDPEFYFSGGASGAITEAIDPRQGEPGANWSGRQIDAFRNFSDLEDGYYQMSIRGIDAKGVLDPNPAKHRFYVFYDDVVPVPIFVSPTTTSTRLENDTRISFEMTATDESRNSTTPIEALEYSYQLRAQSVTNCTTHLNDQFTAWTRFTASRPIVEIGNEFPTIYNDLISPGCEWIFTFRVRDPAGNVASGTHLVVQPPNDGN